MKIAKIQSSGKPGTEKAALLAAKKRGVSVTGYCPKNFEPPFKEIKETPSAKIDQCVIWNVRDSHATLILDFTENSSMTDLAYEVAETYGRPHILSQNPDEIIKWLDVLGEEITLNVIGPNIDEYRLSEKNTKQIMEKILSHYDAIFIL